MIAAFLLPLLALGGPGPVTAAPTAGGDDPAIQIWISNDRRFLPGDRAKVQIRTREDGYLLVLHADPSGHLRVLFPLDPGDDNFVRGGRKYEIKGRGGRESFSVDNNRGQGTVYAAVSHDPFRFDQFVLGDHWDYRNLAPQRLSSDPEQDLNELVRRMVDNSFDYDILTYDVLERVVYASAYAPDYYNYYDDCGYSYFCGRSYYGSPYSLSIGLFFGRPYYHRYFYDPFYAGYNPYYDPFFYDPYYYRPYYYRPYYYPVYNYPYGGGYYYNHYHFSNRYYYANNFYGGWNRPYSPYRFRLNDGSVGPYRDRRYTFGRAVNTVYMPPVVSDRQPANASPARRVTDARPPIDGRTSVDGRTRAPSDANTARRGADRTPTRAPEANGGRRVENRVSQPSIDARRAGPPEEVRSIVPDSRDRTGGRNLPQEIHPGRSDNAPRRAVDRPEPPSADRAAPQIDARRARPEDDGSRSRAGDVGNARPDNRPDPQPQARRYDPSGEASGVYRPETRSPDPRPSEPRSQDRGSSGGGDRGSYSPPPRSAPPPSDGGGMRGGGGGSGSGGHGDGGSGGGGGGGFRRR